MNVEACLKQLDELFEYKKLADVEPFLLECVQRSLSEDRPDAALTFLNELIGYYRSVSRHEDALLIGAEALKWVENMGLSGSKAHATTLVNYATALRAAGKCEMACQLYDEALKVLDRFPLESVQYEKASLFNNLSIAYQQLGDEAHAVDALLTAMGLIEKPSVEEAISLVNIAGCYYRMANNEEGFKASQKAVAIFQGLNETSDAHYASALASLADGYAARNDYVSAAKVNEQAIQYQLDSFGCNDDYYLLIQKQQALLELAGRKAEIPALLKNAAPKKMNGLALSRAYYERFAKNALRHQFPEICDKLAIGLVGMGSECLGMDDEISQDHDFGPGFCIFLPEKWAPMYLAPLTQFYEQLPDTFMGYKRQTTRQGTGRVGVIVIEDFFRQMTGYPYGPEQLRDWMGLDEAWLLTACNGEIFEDNSGIFSTIHQHLANYYPKDIYLKKLAAVLAKMAQAGQYQYARCMRRRELESAQMYIWQFVQEGLHLLFLMNQTYMPYTKWQMPMARNLKVGQPILSKLIALMKLPDGDPAVFEDGKMIHREDARQAFIEEIAQDVTAWLMHNNLSDQQDCYLETQAYIVQSQIEDPEIRSLHLMEE